MSSLLFFVYFKIFIIVCVHDECVVAYVPSACEVARGQLCRVTSLFLVVCRF